MGSIVIYDGPGTDSFCSDFTEKQIKEIIDNRQYQVERYSHAEHLLDREPREVKLFVVPGGNYYEMASSFEPVAAKVRQLVTSSDTNYLGICAGAIAASKMYSYNLDKFQPGKNNAKEPILFEPLSTEMHLQLYPGLTTALSIGTAERFPSAEVVVRCDDNFRTPFPIYLHNGCYFPHAAEVNNTQIVLEYDRIEIDDPSMPLGKTAKLAAAVLHKTKGGSVLLSGVHPEFDSHAVMAIPVPDQQRAFIAKQWKDTREETVNTLNGFQEKQQDTMKSFLSLLGIKTKA